MELVWAWARQRLRRLQARNASKVAQPSLVVGKAHFTLRMAL